ncbi:MAG: hypothetical protein ABI831_27075 [Betaproteobacteria bacterium]
MSHRCSSATSPVCAERSLLQNAVGVGATRTTAVQIEDYLQRLGLLAAPN